MTRLEKILWFLSEMYQSVKPAPVLKYIDEIRPLLVPGDVIATRSPYFERLIPGYWSHVGIFVGDYGGRGEQVVQARGYGVYPLDVHLFLRAGSAVVVRPEISDDLKSGAVQRAISRIGSHYDFEFDFSDDKRLICSELIFYAYRDLLSLETYPMSGLFDNKKVFLPDHIFKRGFQIIWRSPDAVIPE